MVTEEKQITTWEKKRNGVVTRNKGSLVLIQVDRNYLKTEVQL